MFVEPLVSYSDDLGFANVLENSVKCSKVLPRFFVFSGFNYFFNFLHMFTFISLKNKVRIFLLVHPGDVSIHVDFFYFCILVRS